MRKPQFSVVLLRRTHTADVLDLPTVPVHLSWHRTFPAATRALASALATSRCDVAGICDVTGGGRCWSLHDARRGTMDAEKGPGNAMPGAVRAFLSSNLTA
jgi:hypothetical protein